MKLSISELQERYRKLDKQDKDALETFIGLCLKDDRQSVRSLAKKAENAVGKIDMELDRLEKMREFERECEAEGYTLICGIDEAGRGPLAGPVVAGAVILPKDCRIYGLNDSKKLSEKRREELYDEVTQKAVAYGAGIVGPQRIDEINILQADYEAMCEAIGKLSVMPQVLLNDAVLIPQVLLPQKKIIHGDARSLSIAAASIIAKVTRDRLMVEYDSIFPEYGFAEHKGYGTKAHYEAIGKYGPCAIHRKTFLKNLEEHF